MAFAIEDHYKPRFAGDALPRNDTGLVVALADKLETLVGMFGIGQVPTGDKDPFALRRHALGVIRMLVERDLPLAVPSLVAAAAQAFPSAAVTTIDDVTGFMYDRLVGYLRDLGHTTQEVDAVVALRPPSWAQLPARLAAVPISDLTPHWTAVANLLLGSLAGAWAGASWATRMRSTTLYRVLAVLLVAIAAALGASGSSASHA